MRAAEARTDTTCERLALGERGRRRLRDEFRRARISMWAVRVYPLPQHVPSIYLTNLRWCVIILDMESITNREGKMKRTTVSDYMNETVNYGGLPCTRREMIEHLTACAKSRTNDPAQIERIVGMYVLSFDRHNG